MTLSDKPVEALEHYIAYDLLHTSVADDRVKAAMELVSALLSQVERDSRLEEIGLMGCELGESKPKETWKDWSWRVLEYLEARKAELQSLEPGRE